jgi:hypothetical protein
VKEDERENFHIDIDPHDDCVNRRVVVRDFFFEGDLTRACERERGEDETGGWPSGNLPVFFEVADRVCLWDFQCLCRAISFFYRDRELLG